MKKISNLCAVTVLTMVSAVTIQAANTNLVQNLNFKQGTIESFDSTGTNILIVLHACNTATDDAIYKGITAKADFIVVATGSSFARLWNARTGERIAELKEIGAGVALHPNAMKVLRAIGVEDKVRKVAGRSEWQVMRNWKTGRMIAKTSRQQQVASFGTAGATDARGDAPNSMARASSLSTAPGSRVGYAPFVLRPATLGAAQILVALDGVAIANSICFSLDGKRMYYCDTTTRRIMVCDYDSASARVSEPRLFVKKEADDGYPVMQWEAVALELAHRAGIDVPTWRLEPVADRTALLLRRFDRQGETRVPFLSAMSMLGAADNEDHSYLEIVDALRQFGSQPEQDCAQLWRRIVFNILISNTDDHLRNHGFLYDPARDLRVLVGVAQQHQPHARRGVGLLDPVAEQVVVAADARDAAPGERSVEGHDLVVVGLGQGAPRDCQLGVLVELAGQAIGGHGADRCGPPHHREGPGERDAEHLGAVLGER